MESSVEQGVKENKVDEEEELISDFSDMFKGKGFPKRKPKLSSKQIQTVTPNWLLEIPTKLDLTKQELCQRKMFDQRRWHSIAKANCEGLNILASAVSAWNYLFSSKGTEELPTLTVNKAVEVLEAKGVNCYSMTEQGRVKMALKCFDSLCSEFKVKGQGKVLFKPLNPNKSESTEKEALDSLIQGLKTQEKAFILITSEKIVCPMGFEYTPQVPIDAYKKMEDIKPQNLELWIMTGTVERLAPSFVIKRWKHINECLSTAWPNYIDLDEPKKGPVRHPTATGENEGEERGNLGCMLQFSLVR